MFQIVNAFLIESHHMDHSLQIKFRYIFDRNLQIETYEPIEKKRNLFVENLMLGFFIVFIHSTHTSL